MPSSCVAMLVVSSRVQSTTSGTVLKAVGNRPTPQQSVEASTRKTAPLQLWDLDSKVGPSFQGLWSVLTRST